MNGGPVVVLPVVARPLVRDSVVGQFCHLLAPNLRTLCGAGDNWPGICPDYAGETICRGCRRETCPECVRIAFAQKVERNEQRSKSLTARPYKPRNAA